MMMKMIILIIFLFMNSLIAKESKKKIYFIAGPDSHRPGCHEHDAGCELMAERIRKQYPQFQIVVYKNGWPENSSFINEADAVIVFSDGGRKHAVMNHLDKVNKISDRGVGIGFIHYAVEPTMGTSRDLFLKWIGGCFEINWSVNPHWEAQFKQIPEHPVTRGVKPFQLFDEWYYHMRFRDHMKGVTPLLSALPPAETLKRRDGLHSNNPHVRASVLERKEKQHVAWASVRSDGGRGFGFTGGHFHENFKNDQFRKLLLNAII
jgi:hypothetical protein